jgi:hypothetical protein
LLDTLAEILVTIGVNRFRFFSNKKECENVRVCQCVREDEVMKEQEKHIASERTDVID